MTSITDLIPRLRLHRTGRVVAVRCTKCRTWRKPNRFDRNTNVCRPCTYGEARRRVLDRTDSGKYVAKYATKLR
jgi:ssDNA-binding Zn-finger/Zn-ribbon topoisomerase 1